MLWFEREVVAGLTATDDARKRADVEAFVDGALHAMPEFLRAGIATASIGIGSIASVVQRVRPVPAVEVVDVLDRNPIGPVRQYVRLFRSLVLFAEQELP